MSTYQSQFTSKLLYGFLLILSGVFLETCAPEQESQPSVVEQAEQALAPAVESE